MKAKPRRQPARRSAKIVRLPGDLSDRQLLERILRVNHAGEFGAQQIYAGQIAVLGRGRHGATLRHMAEQEAEHLRAFAALLTRHRSRPTALLPVWRVAGRALGLLTAALGEKTAMACTIAVEQEIHRHYTDQLRQLAGRQPQLARLLRRFRAEENEHEATARAAGGEQAPLWPFWQLVIRGGSRLAIRLSERL